MIDRMIPAFWKSSGNMRIVPPIMAFYSATMVIKLELDIEINNKCNLIKKKDFFMEMCFWIFK